MHDTEGWKSLETSMRSLQNLIEGTGPKIYLFDFKEVLELVDKSIVHVNRFVREISYFVVNSILQASKEILKSEG